MRSTGDLVPAARDAVATLLDRRFPPAALSVVQALMQGPSIYPF